MSFTCNKCRELMSECQCSPKLILKKTILPSSCEWRDARGVKCGKDFKFNAPRPGIKPIDSPTNKPEQWIKYCEYHYEYERPDDWMDESLESHKAKLEKQYGSFGARKGKDMTEHCLKIIYEMGGETSKIAKMLERSMRKTAREEGMKGIGIRYIGSRSPQYDD